ncbi:MULTISPECIES: NAD(P)/FAD-dependent oxidoreductase [unclassified Mycobacterium]|uniref:NAD(P)/FAD-dependent oxidoreductase n=1 Tax=unclassified Mycobacterium TaxID=2642494 RepID=UPI0029C8A26B|nr:MULTISPECIES: NAD(P)/FAD-dependent oxidoreductase [unclassified Mycobacterium]
MTVYSADVLIVGAGPVGLYGAYYAGVRGLRVAVIDSLSQLGGQITAMYPEKQIFDIAGYPAVKGRDLVDALAEQAASASPFYILGQEAQQLSTDSSGTHTITTTRGDELRCGAIIITAGIGTFTPRKLSAGEDYLGRGLEYFVPNPTPYAATDVVIVGGGDSALDWALMLEPIAASVTVVHRRKAFRAHAATVAQVERSTVELITDAEVGALGGNGAVAHADIAIKGTDDMRRVECQRVVAALGFVANLGPLREWGVELRDNRHIVVDSAMRTGRTGVFAAGDVVDYDGKVRLISVGFGEVATAVNNAAVHIDPQAQLFPGHSTDEQPAPTLTPA